MYNKIFGKILDSSIWLEPSPTRIVWLMFIAAMDETGMVVFASIANVAHRAIISLEEATEAIRILESPDSNSSDPDNEGRRIERVPGGWIILNASKYRELVTREMVKNQTRLRVARHRQRNASVTQGNDLLTPSDTDTRSYSEKIYCAYPRKIGKPKAVMAIEKAFKKITPPELLAKTEAFAKAQNGADPQFIPHPSTWFNQERFNDDPSTWRPPGKTSLPVRRENINPPITRR